MDQPLPAEPRPLPADWRVRAADPAEAPRELLLLADPSLERVNRYLSYCTVWLGESDGGVVAVAAVQRQREGFEIMNLAVDRAVQRRGLGRALVTHVLQWAEREGARGVMVGTGNSSLGQLAFYQKCGFRITGVVRGFFEGAEPPIMENGIWCRDMVRLALELRKPAGPDSRAPWPAR